MTIHRKVLAAVSWLSLGNLLVRALSLVTMPVLTHYLSPQAYGEAALVGTIVSLASVVALAGIDMSYSRHAFSGKLGAYLAIEAFCWRWALFASLVIAVAVGIIWLMLSMVLEIPASLAGFVVVGVVASAMATMAQTRARLDGKYSKMTWVQFVTGCVCAAASLGVAIVWRQDAWSLLIAMILGYSLPVILLGTPSWRQLVRPSSLMRVQRKSVLATGLAGIITAPSYWVLSSSDRWFLAAYHDSSEVGIYSIGYTVGTLGAVISAAITSAWLPELSRAESEERGRFSKQKSEMVQALAALLMIVAVAVAAAGGDVIRALADARFHSAVTVVPWLSAAVFFYGCVHVGNALLVMRAKLHWAAWSWIVALTGSLLMNWWLVPVNGGQGAALVQAISFMLVMILIWIAVLRFESINLKFGRLVAGVLASLATSFILQPSWSSSAWLSLLMKFPVGVVYAAICLCLVAPDMVQQNIRKLKGSF